MKKTIITALVATLAALASACASADNVNTTNTTANTNTATTTTTTAPIVATTANTNNASAPGEHAAPTGDDVPASVRAVFSGTMSLTKQHRDITPAQISAIEKTTGGKVPDTDHHSYLAFATEGGARKQVGAATVINANGKEFVVVYGSRNGMPYIKEVRGGGGGDVPQAFLDQFKGKGHDDKFQVGQDLKAQGADEATANAIAAAVRTDAVTMQTLYGSAHSH